MFNLLTAKNINFVFTAINFTLIAVFVIALLIPSVISIRNGKYSLRLEEERYIIVSAHGDAFEENQILLLAHQENTRLRHVDTLGYELAEVQKHAATLSLTEHHFTSNPLINHDVFFNVINEITELRVEVEYEGLLADILTFINEIDVVLHAVSVKHGEHTAMLFVEFSLFGSGVFEPNH